MEALVRDRDAAIQKCKVAEQACVKWKAEAEASTELQYQVEGLKDTIRVLEVQQAESRAFELQMARITSSLEQERDLLQTEVLKYSGMAVSYETVQKLSKRVEELEREKKMSDEDLVMTMRAYEDQLDAEKVLAQGALQESQFLRGVMGTGIEEIRAKMETGMQLALNRVDEMETLLWQERAKTKKYLRLLTQLVDQEDLEVLLADDEGSVPPAGLVATEAEFEFQKK
jgi:hypothetical protein